jgi:arylsulfatase A-like enzyme
VKSHPKILLTVKSPLNILLIMSDQQRWDSLGCTGAPWVSTPHLDTLAAQGVLFSNCYANNPICTPARASLMTGLELPGHGVYQLHDILDPRVVLFPQRLRERGYHTALYGKLHVSGRIEEAVRRVESYSRVFFTMGAAAYCANNYVMGVAAMLERLLAGATLSEAYEAEATMWNEIAYRGTSTYVPAYHLVISTHHKSGTVTIFTWENGRERRRTVPRFREYDLAYAGDPAFRLRPAP